MLDRNQKITFLSLLGMLVGVAGILRVCSAQEDATTTQEIASTYVGGELSGAVTWELKASPYLVTQNVIVPSGSTLVIQPGVEVRFQAYALTVQGTLISRGTSEMPVVFTSAKADPQPGDWQFLTFAQSSLPAIFDRQGNYQSGSVLEHSVIEFGSGINLAGSAPWISECKIRFNAKMEGGGIFSGGGSPRIEKNLISHNYAERDGGGIRAAGGNPQIINNEIVFNTARGAGGAIATNFSPIGIRSNYIAHNWASYGGGIVTGKPRLGEAFNSVTAYSKPEIVGNTIANNLASYSGGGIDVRGTPRIVNNLILFNRILYDGRSDKRHEAARMDSTDRRKRVGAGLNVQETRDGAAVVQGNAIIGNRGAQFGGGAFFDQASLLFEDNLVAHNQAVDFGGGISISNRSPGQSFGSRSYGDKVMIARSTFRNNEGVDCEISGPGGQVLRIEQCNFLIGPELALANHCTSPVQTGQVWWGSEARQLVLERVHDGSDDRSLGAVALDLAPQVHALDNVPQFSSRQLAQMTAVPENIRAGQGIFQLPDAPPQITVAWDPIPGEWVAGYRVGVCSITETYSERTPVRLSNGNSPFDVGTDTSLRLEGLKASTNYEVRVWAYDAKGKDLAASEPVRLTTNPAAR